MRNKTYQRVLLFSLPPHFPFSPIRAAAASSNSPFVSLQNPHILHPTFTTTPVLMIQQMLATYEGKTIISVKKTIDSVPSIRAGVMRSEVGCKGEEGGAGRAAR